MKTVRYDKPPRHLTAESKAIWRQICEEWELDTQALILLRTALEAFDRYHQARKQLSTEGLTVKSPTGQVRRHPATDVERQARASFLQSWRMLNLGIEPPGDIGRPPGR